MPSIVVRIMNRGGGGNEKRRELTHIIYQYYNM
jgi:hypothetical protein